MGNKDPPGPKTGKLEVFNGLIVSIDLCQTRRAAS